MGRTEAGIEYCDACRKTVRSGGLSRAPGGARELCPACFDLALEQDRLRPPPPPTPSEEPNHTLFDLAGRALSAARALGRDREQRHVAELESRTAPRPESSLRRLDFSSPDSPEPAGLEPLLLAILREQRETRRYAHGLWWLYVRLPLHLLLLAALMFLVLLLLGLLALALGR
jgi:hypothetical protein